MSYRSEVLADRPQLYLRLDETSGTQAADASEYADHGSYVNGPTLGQPGALSSEPASKSVYFAATAAQHALISPPAQSTTWTAEMWVKHDGGTGGFQCLLGNAAGSFTLFLRSTFALDLWYSAASHLTALTLAQGRWYHIVVSCNAGTATLYVDGELVTTFTAVPTGFEPTRVGSDGSSHFKGWVDELALYPLALSQARAREHYYAAWRGLRNLAWRLRLLLGDTEPSSYRWLDADLWAALRRATNELETVAPYERKTTSLLTTAGSRDLDVSSLLPRLAIEGVEYPVGEYPPRFVPFSLWGSTLTMDLEGEPSGAEAVHVYWSAPHTLELDSTTLDQTLEDVVLAGAAAYAAEAWAMEATNRGNIGGAGAIRDFSFRASSWRREFQAQLQRRRSRLRARVLYAPVNPQASQDAVRFE